MELERLHEDPPPPSALARLGWCLLGLLALAISLLGVVVPVFPGLPFALLAGLCFATASRRLHLRLARIPALRRPLDDWQRASRSGPRAQLGTALALTALGVLEGLRACGRALRRLRGRGAHRRMPR